MTQRDCLPGKFYCDGEGGDVFVHQSCPKCSRFVKMPETILVNGLGEVKAPAVCKRCGPVELVPEFLPSGDV